MSLKEVRLGDICLVKRGTTITQKQAIEGDIPVVAGGLKPTYYHNQPNRFGTTITVSGSGANAGFVNLWKQPIFASDCSTVEVKNSELDIQYIYYFLLSKQEYIYKKLRSGAAQPHVYGKDIADLLINIPPFSTQNKLVTKLDAIFAEIDKATVATETNIRNAESLFQSYLTEIFEKGGKDWISDTIGNLCAELFAGGDVPKDRMSKEITKEFTIPIFTNGEKAKGLYGFTDKSRVTKPSITISARGTIGYSEVRYEPFYPAIRLIVATPKTDIIELDYLKYAIKSLKFVHSGTSIPQLTVPMIKNYSIKLPKSKDEQIEIVSKLDKLSAEVKSLQASVFLRLGELSNLRQSILQKAFAGELIKD